MLGADAARGQDGGLQARQIRHAGRAGQRARQALRRALNLQLAPRGRQRGRQQRQALPAPATARRRGGRGLRAPQLRLRCIKVYARKRPAAFQASIINLIGQMLI